MTNRRGQGEGAIYRRASDGKWVGAVELGYESGKRRRKTVYGKSRMDVVKKIHEVHKVLDKSLSLPDERTTVAAFLQWWVTEVLPGSVKDSTADGYRWVIDRYLIPHIGRVRLAQLRPEHVHSMLKALEGQGLSPRTCRQARTILGRALKQAERWGKVSRNVVALVDAPPLNKTEVGDALTITEAEALLTAAARDRIGALVTVALALGVRRGEALGLQWSDVDLNTGQIVIQRTLKRRVGHGLVVDTPKTAHSNRTLPIPSVCIDALRDHRLRQGEERRAAGSAWQETGFVFTTPIGTPIDPRNLTREYHRLTVKAGLGPRRFHALRHSAATLMLAMGVKLEVISSVLGHAGYAITADIYAKVGPMLKVDAIEAMDSALQSAIIRPMATHLATSTDHREGHD
jgi:integrase